MSAEHRWAVKPVPIERGWLLTIRNCCGGRSYTIDTLRTVQQQNPNAILCWIVGEDSCNTAFLASLASYVGYCNFVVLNDQGRPWDGHCSSPSCITKPVPSAIHPQWPSIEARSADVNFVNGKHVSALLQAGVYGDMIDADVMNISAIIVYT